MKVSSWAGIDSASTYYRQEVPFKAAASLGLIEWDLGNRWPSVTDTSAWSDTILKGMSHDVLHYYSSINDAVNAMIEISQKVRKQNEKTPVFIYDCDDNTEEINPLNPVFETLGTRDLRGKKLKPGAELMIPMPGKEPLSLWKDGRGGFDVKRNLKTLKLCGKIMRNSDGVTVSTTRLANYWINSLKLKNVFVMPNSIIESDWPQVKPKHTGTIRVLWQGGNAHYPDWYEIREAVSECVKKFPEVVWVIWGEKFDWIHDVIPKDRLEFHNWVPYAAYRYKLATLDFDFALAPLVPNRFNACKSAIKWYEAAMMGKPTLASRTPPYSDEIIEGQTGLLYRTQQEFVDGFEKLVRDKELRERLVKNSRDWISDNRDATKTVPKLIEWMRETKEKVGANGSKNDQRQESLSDVQ